MEALNAEELADALREYALRGWLVLALPEDVAAPLVGVPATQASALALSSRVRAVVDGDVFYREQVAKIVRESFEVGKRCGMQLVREKHMRGYDVDRLVERLVGEGV